MKERISITIDSELFYKIEKISKKEKIPRSKIIREALKLWDQQRTKILMRKGYLESADEDRDLAELGLESGNEVVK